MKPLSEKQFRRCSKFTQSWLVKQAFGLPHTVFYSLVRADGTQNGIYGGSVTSRDYIVSLLECARRSKKHRSNYRDVTIRRSLAFPLAAQYIHIAVDIVLDNLNKQGWDVALHFGADGLHCCTAWNKRQPISIPSERARHTFWGRNMAESVCLVALSVCGLIKPE